MSSEPPPADAGIAPRRLHPAGIAVLAVGALRSLALPLAVAFAGGVAGGGGGQPVSRAVIFGVLGALAAAAAGLLGWMTTRWSVGNGRIRLRTGVLSEKETDVPLGRVQSIDTVHGPLQRLFGVRGVQVQTAGGAREAEITLLAVRPADVELLRAAVRGRGAVATTVEPAPLAERRLGRRRLLVAALTAGQVGVLLPFLAALPQLGQELWGDDLETAGRQGLRLVPHSAPEWVLAAAGVLGLAWLLSTGGAVLAFSGFTIARDADRLRVRRGLLARREATVPVARVQAVRVVEGLLRRPFGLAAVHAEVAGYAKEAAAAQTLFPLPRRAEVEPFLAALLPELADGIDGLGGAPRRALRRYMLPPAAGCVALGAGAWTLIPGAGPWPVLAAVPAAALGAARWRAAGWRIADRRVAVRFRRLARITVLAPAARLQQHGTRQTVLQRRPRLADVEVRVGAGTRARVRHLDAAAAGRVFDALRPAEGGSGQRPERGREQSPLSPRREASSVASTNAKEAFMAQPGADAVPSQIPQAEPAPPADAELKARHRKMWASGDYDSMVETFLLPLGPRLVEACRIGPGMTVLDVGAGSGNAAIPAAQAGADVTASDLTPELLDAGRRRAQGRGVELAWMQADAEALPFADGSFDVVMSSIGAMFAPHHDAVAAELVRVCRPGGTLGLLSWTPQGMIGALFRLMGPFAPPPPPGAQPPPLWGSEEHLADLFGSRVEYSTLARDVLEVTAFERPHGYATHFKERYGPTIVTQANARRNGREAEFETALDAFCDEWNRGTPDRARFEMEYLLAVGTRAS